MNVIEMKGLYKKLGTFTMKDVNLGIPKGYISGLVGENGSGKTTLLNLLNGLKKADSGSIEILGTKDIEKDRVDLLNRTGIVFSEDNFPQDKSAAQLEDIFKMFYENWDSQLYHKYLKDFEIDWKRKIIGLSTGEKMKLSLAVALSHHAELLLLDEPTSNLDPTFRMEFLELLQELMLNEEMSILFSTHITSDLERISDYIIMIDDGEILFNMDNLELTGTYKKVRGPLDIIDDEIDDLLIGRRDSSLGFEAMTKNNQALTELFGDRLVIEHLTIDEIMYYIAQHKRGVADV